MFSVAHIFESISLLSIACRYFHLLYTKEFTTYCVQMFGPVFDTFDPEH